MFNPSIPLCQLVLILLFAVAYREEGMDTKNRQVQNIAFPKNLSNRYLREWAKPDYNQIMEPVDGLNSSQFRDPSTWIGHDGPWRQTAGAEIRLKGRALLYKGQDFVHWVRVKDPLHATNGLKMLEFPDFFPVGDAKSKKFMLKVSLIETQSDHYMLGTYDQVNDRFVLDKDVIDDYRMWRRYDYVNIYASKPFFDEKKKCRIFWGWSEESESDTAYDDMAKGGLVFSLFLELLIWMSVEYNWCDGLLKRLIH